MDQYQKYIHTSRYARYLPEENRRETWDETVDRYINFFKERNEDKNIPWQDLRNAIYDLEVMPSMRAMMTAGKALDRDNVAGYNCAYVAVDEMKVFSEILFILMCGTGVGFSVERQFINKLPEVPDEIHPTDTTIVVRDSKLGWAVAYRQLIAMLYSGSLPKWDVSRVRPAGTRLKTFGGRSSGPGPLEDLFNFTVEKFAPRIRNGKPTQGLGRKLNSIECHDIICKVADIVVCGGVRRSALLSLTNLTDERMQRAKVGNFWDLEPQRQLANISTCYTEPPDMGIFMREWSTLHESGTGERGIFNRIAAQKMCPERRENEHDFGTNPCSEIVLRSKQFCNLTEVVVRNGDTKERLKQKIELATILGTLQATLTDFRFLSAAWRNNTEEERLLGVSLTGIMDHKTLSRIDTTAASWYREMKEHAVEVNKKYSTMLGIPQSAAITCTKPSGCTTLDTKIRTEHGVMSMAEIFAKYGKEDIEFSDIEPRTWFDLKESLRVYDENNDLQLVTKLFVNGMEETYRIELEDGNVYRFTGNHKLKTKTGWKRVDELTEDDDITMKIVAINKEKTESMTVDIEVENTHSYQLENGCVSHNTVSQLVNSASGIHPRYSEYYVRTVRQDKKDSLAKWMIDHGFPVEDDLFNSSNYVFSFPVKGPHESVFRNEMSAIEQLEHWKQVQVNYCEHKPSITVYIREHEWLEVGAWVYKNFKYMSGVSFLPYSGGLYKQAPYQECTKEEYENLLAKMPNVDFSEFIEEDDYTTASQEFACVGNSCEIVS